MVVNSIFKVAHKVAHTWKRWEVFAPRVLLALLGFALLTLFVQLSQATFSKAAVFSEGSSITVGCTGGEANQQMKAAMVVHKFSTQEEADRYFNYPTDEEVKRLVGMAPNSDGKGGGCDINNNFCQDADNGGCGANKNGSCEASAPIPSCSVVQLDCLGGDKNGTIKFNRTGCPQPPKESHLECKNNACVKVNGKGDNQCAKEGDSCGEVKKPEVVCKSVALRVIDGRADRVQALVTGEAKNGATITRYEYEFGAGTPREFSNAPDNGRKYDYAQPGTYHIKVWVIGVGPTGQALRESSPSCQGDVTITSQKHFTCEKNACVEKAGPGDTKAQCESKCGTVETHAECRDNACVTGIPGAGPKTCDSTCGQTQYHFECKNNACARVNTAGPNKDGCTAGNVGTACNLSHLECKNNACVKVNTGGPNTGGCVAEGQGCGQVQYAVCDNLAVSPQSGDDSIEVTANLSGHTVGGGSIVSYRYTWGDGTETVTNNGSTKHLFNNPGVYTINGFVTDNKGNQIGGTASCRKQVEVKCTDCGEKTHAVCIDNQCQIRSGDGPQSCSSDCGQAHHVCRNESCTYVSGALRDGDVLCSSDLNCRKDEEQHLECRNEACTIVNGAGSDTCTTDANCKPSNPTHTVCQNEACITLAGSGKSQCVVSSDCVRTVVYENIPNTGPEMPILGGLFSSGILGWFIRKLKFGN